MLNIWADRDLLFKPSLEDGKAVAVKRQEALLAAKAEEAARQAAAAQALKRAAEAKLNPRSKAPRLAALENEYGNSTGAGRSAPVWLAAACSSPGLVVQMHASSGWGMLAGYTPCFVAACVSQLLQHASLELGNMRNSFALACIMLQAAPRWLRVHL